MNVRVSAVCCAASLFWPLSDLGKDAHCRTMGMEIFVVALTWLEQEATIGGKT